jgi:hypothetical protein
MRLSSLGHLPHQTGIDASGLCIRCDCSGKMNIELTRSIRPFGDGLCPRTGQFGFPAASGFPFEESIQSWVGINRRGVILHQAARIGGWAVITELFPAEHSK